MLSLHTPASSPEDYVDILADELKPYSLEEKRPMTLVNDEPTGGLSATETDAQSASRNASTVTTTPAAALSISRHKSKSNAVPVVRFHNLHEAALRTEGHRRSSVFDPELGVSIFSILLLG